MFAPGYVKTRAIFNFLNQMKPQEGDNFYPVQSFKDSLLLLILNF